VFSEAASGEQHGYFDGWRADDHFHYTGEGQRGDQVMKGGNAAILRHVADGRALRVFDGAGGRVTYVGEFELATDRPYYTTDAPETKTGRPRSVIVFRLQPLDTAPRPSVSPLDRVNQPGVEHVRSNSSGQSGRSCDRARRNTRRSVASRCSCSRSATTSRPLVTKSIV
jgi:hypothetical protein